MTSRSIAFKVLLQEARAQAYLNLALDAALRSEATLPRQESALATELVYGVARRALALDAAIAAHSSRPVRKLEPAVLVALRLGAYQLLFLDRVPPHAAVAESVELLKHHGYERAAGFVNAVLRRIAAEPGLPLPADPLERISVAQSHPLWLVRRWAARFGADEAAALCAADNLPPPVCVRVNATRATRDEVVAALAAEGVTATPTPLSPLGLRLESSGALPVLQSFRRGLFQVQDEAAQLVGLLAEVEPGQRVLDACAAPGGKSCLLAEQLRGRGEVQAIDLHPRKLERLQEESRRLGLQQTLRSQAGDATGPLPFPERSFDRILLDAPCTGLGTLRRHPELRYRRREEDIPRMAELQRTMIENLTRYLAPGGQLVYAVCSTEPEEGAAQADRLERDGWRPVEARREDFPRDRVGAGAGRLATFPHRHQADGFFAARLSPATAETP